MRLHHLRHIRNLVENLRRLYLKKVFGMDIHRTAKFSMTAKFDKTNPRGVHVGSYSYVAFDASILTHDLTRGVRRHTVVLENCFIGARSILMPGVRVGPNSIVAAGAIVTKDVPPFSIVAGNPAVVVRNNIDVGQYGRFGDANERQQRESKENGFE